MDSPYSFIEHETLTLPRMVQFMMREGAYQRSDPLEACVEVMQRSGGYGSGSIHGERITRPPWLSAVRQLKCRPGLVAMWWTRGHYRKKHVASATHHVLGRLEEELAAR